MPLQQLKQCAMDSCFEGTQQAAKKLLATYIETAILGRELVVCCGSSCANSSSNPEPNKAHTLPNSEENRNAENRSWPRPYQQQICSRFLAKDLDHLRHRNGRCQRTCDRKFGPGGAKRNTY